MKEILLKIIDGVWKIIDGVEYFINIILPKIVICLKKVLWKIIDGIEYFINILPKIGIGLLILLVLSGIIAGFFTESQDSKMSKYSEMELLERLEREKEDYRKKKIYIELLTRNPNSKEYLSELNKIEIKEQFSYYNGSNKHLERYIKQNLNDPSSFQHVATYYYFQCKNNECVDVEMTFRGKNQFGALITATAEARIDVEGNITKIKIF